MSVAPGKNYVGSNIRIDIIFSDDLGVRTDPLSVAFKARDACGTEVSYVYDGVSSNLERLSAGEYIASIVPMTAGRWYFRWEAVDTFNLPFVREGKFVVQASPFFDHSEPGYSS